MDELEIVQPVSRTSTPQLPRSFCLPLRERVDKLRGGKGKILLFTGFKVTSWLCQSLLWRGTCRIGNNNSLTSPIWARPSDPVLAYEGLEKSRSCSELLDSMRCIKRSRNKPVTGSIQGCYWRTKRTIVLYAAPKPVHRTELCLCPARKEKKN